MSIGAIIVLALVLALGNSAVAKSIGLPNELINGSWESGDDTAWMSDGGEVVDLNTWFMTPGRALGEVDDYGYGVVCAWYDAYGEITQDVSLVGAHRVIDLSGWLWAWDTGGVPSWIELQLLINGEVVGSQRVSASGGMVGWTYVDIQWSGFVAGTCSARVIGSVQASEDTIGFGTGWGVVCADGIDLEDGIPLSSEPTSLLVLLGGLAAIRRRK